MPRRSLFLFACLLPCLLGLTDAAVAAERVLRFGVQVSKMGALDPHFAAGSQDRAMADMVFNGLLRYQPGEAPKIAPDLAVAIPTFEMVNGRQVWTVRLRRDVMFHPGPRTAAYPLTSADVVFSLRKAADEATSAYAGEYIGMTFEAVDDHTVRIVSQTPMSTVLFLPKFTNYGGGFIVSRRAVEAMGLDGFKKHPVGTGPFVFQAYTPERKVVLGAHRDYFRGAPRLGGVEIHLVPDSDQRGEAFLAGSLDVIIASGRKGWLAAMDKKPGITIDTHGVGEITTVFLNTKMPPLDDVRVRKAIAYAIDRQTFMDTIDARLVGGPAYSPVPAQLLPGGIDRTAAVQLGLDYGTDLDKARRLMAAAGHADGFTLRLVSSEKRLYRRYYEALKKDLARIGITCDIDIVPHAEMHRSIRKTPQAIVIYVAWRPNADVYLTRFFHTDSVVVTGAKPDTNFSHYTVVDRLIESARTEVDPDRQIRLWVQAQIRILSDMAALPILTTRQCYLRHNTVDYGHPLASTMALYPQFTETTRISGE